MHREVKRAARGPKTESPVVEIARLRAELEHERAVNERYRLAAQSATNLIYDWDLGTRVDWYRKVPELLGYEPNMFQRTMDVRMSQFHPEDRERVLAAVEKKLKSEEPYCLECRVNRKDGTYLHWLERGSVVYDAASNPRKWIGAVTDITERKLQAARERRAKMRRSSSENLLTERKAESKLPAVGETEAGHAGERLAMDNRLGRRTLVMGDYSTYSLQPFRRRDECSEAPHASHNSGVWGTDPGTRESQDFGRSGAFYHRETIVHFPLNQAPLSGKRYPQCLDQAPTVVR